MTNVISLARSSLLASLAALGFVAGAGMTGYSLLAAPPGRADLQLVEGNITEASRVTRKNRRTGTATAFYELKLRPSTPGATPLKLRVPATEMAEADVRWLIGRMAKAEFDTEQDIFVLGSGARELLTYQESLTRRNLSYRQYYVDGIALMAGASVLLGVGLLIGYRRQRRATAKLAAQE